MKRLAILILLVACISAFAFEKTAFGAMFTYTSNTAKYLTGGPEFDLDLINATGVTWTDFHFEISGYVGAYGFVGDSYIGPGTAEFGGPGYYGLYQPLDIAGLNIPDGGTYSLSFAIGHVGEVLPGYFLTGTPSVGGVAVPELVTLLLVSAGLLGVGVGRRRLQK